MSVDEKDFLLSSYDFILPEEQIAQEPPITRGGSRLLVFNRDKNTETLSTFEDIIDHLPENAVLVANNSKVFPARLEGKKISGGKVEFLLLTPFTLLEYEQNEENTQNEEHGINEVHKSNDDDKSHEKNKKHEQSEKYFKNRENLNSEKYSSCIAQGLLRASKSPKVEEKVIFSEDFYLEVLDKQEFGQSSVRIFWKGDLKSHIEKNGNIPLPPYIKRASTEEDLLRYQTIYAKEEKLGSVAAPTAGLHFTDKIRESLKKKNITWCEVTLYVGYGTFSPVRTEDIREHTMHHEYYEISQNTADILNNAKKENRPIIAVGTTSCRALEGMFLERKNIEACTGSTNIFIYPSRSFNVIDGILTNFHLPKSSLIIMLAGLVGREKVLTLYEHAIKNDFRFFSYGDAMLIL